MATAASRFDLARFGMERHELLAAPGRRADLRRPRAVQARAGACGASGSRCRSPSGASRWARAPRRAACSTTTPWCRASTRSFRSTSTCRAVRRAPKGCMYGIMMLQKKVMSERMARRVAARRDGARSASPAVHPAAGASTSCRSRSATRFIRRGPACERRASTPAPRGSALGDAAAPATPTNVPHRGGAANPSVDALRRSSARRSRARRRLGRDHRVRRPGAAPRDHAVAARRPGAAATTISSDVTAVEYRDLERPLEVVWHLRSLPVSPFLRLKVAARQAAAARGAERVGHLQGRRLARARVLRHVRHHASPAIPICAAS